MAQFVDPHTIKSGEFNDRELLRAIRQSIAAEHEAVHLYEVIADSTNNGTVKKVMQDIAKEEKVHAHEFQNLLNMLDGEEKESQEQAKKEVEELSGEVSENIEITLNGEKYLLEEGDRVDVIPGGKTNKKTIGDITKKHNAPKKAGNTITEAAVHRRYLLVSDGNEDRCFSPASANDNYMIYFLDRLCRSKRFNNGNYKVKIVRKIPNGCKKMSLETFLKELMPVPEKTKK